MVNRLERRKKVEQISDSKPLHLGGQGEHVKSTKNRLALLFPLEQLELQVHLSLENLQPTYSNQQSISTIKVVVAKQLIMKLKQKYLQV